LENKSCPVSSVAVSGPKEKETMLNVITEAIKIN
jgi:hypothetical protein